MASYRLEVKRSAEKELRALSQELIDRIWTRIRALTTNPRPRGAKKLAGDVPGYRLRVGDYRILYEIDDTERLVSVRQVRHRRDAYR
ncbi:MAG: type II toxin-antitoxin system RelE family toxin [bacterium]